MTHFFRIPAIAALFCLSAFAEAPKWKKVLPALPDSLTLHSEVICSQTKERDIKLEIYVPKAGDKHPAILLIHGGGWKANQIEADRPLAERLASHGYVVVQVPYRLSTEAHYPAALHDCKAALRFMRAHAADYKINSDRIGVMGGSAGGHLSGLMGMTGGMKNLEGEGGSPGQSTKLSACIVMAASMDLVKANEPKNNEGAIAFLGPITEKRELYVEASPITHVSKTSPPTLFIEGEKDSLKIGRAEMQDKLRAAGAPTDLVTLKDAPHPYWMSQPWLDEAVETATKWFDKYLK
jgi:pectinesterase